MKFYIALLLFTLQVKLCLSAGSAADTVDGKLPFFMKDILNDSDLEKRHKVDHLSLVSCRYIKKNGYCKHSFIKNELCHITCGCKDVLSQKSCNIVKAKNKCQTSWSTYYCRSTCDQCSRLSCKNSTPLGMKSGAIPDARITASSMYDRNHSPARGRLDTKQAGSVRGGWSAGSNNAHQWLQVDLGKVTKVTHIATQGRQDSYYNQWVKSYSLQYSLNGKHFVEYKGGKIFKGNKDQNSIVKHALKPAIIAKYIRVRVKTWHSHISMRMELYGCK